MQIPASLCSDNWARDGESIFGADEDAHDCRREGAAEVKADGIIAVSAQLMISSELLRRQNLLPVKETLEKWA